MISFLLSFLLVGTQAPEPIFAPDTVEPDSVHVASSVRLSPVARGRSGALRSLVVPAGGPLAVPLEWEGDFPEGLTYEWLPADGGRADEVLGRSAFEDGLNAPRRPGVWRLRLSAEGWQETVEDLKIIVPVGIERREGRHLNGYHMGRWPAERSGRGGRYAPPSHFIEVTERSRSARISEHLTLGQFLTKDQHDVWPKYVALDMRLIDKLELVMQELTRMGVRADHLHVMSGFRTPQYNAPAAHAGRATYSRHTYGDAADVWVDNEGRGWMSDLNGDGRVDVSDALVIAKAVERVEARYPELIGGIGVYYPAPHRGPFVHIDVRGVSSRW